MKIRWHRSEKVWSSRAKYSTVSSSRMDLLSTKRNEKMNFEMLYEKKKRPPSYFFARDANLAPHQSNAKTNMSGRRCHEAAQLVAAPTAIFP